MAGSLSHTRDIGMKKRLPYTTLCVSTTLWWPLFLIRWFHFKLIPGGRHRTDTVPEKENLRSELQPQGKRTHLEPT
jgi:hypothetical protein